VPVDLGKITTDAYVVAGVADHITPWQSCYKTTGLLGGKTDFVLSTSGHIAALVNAPTNPKASFQTSTQNPASAQEFKAAAEEHQGRTAVGRQRHFAAPHGGARHWPGAGRRCVRQSTPRSASTRLRVRPVSPLAPNRVRGSEVFETADTASTQAIRLFPKTIGSNGPQGTGHFPRCRKAACEPSQGRM
jgi:hypothetical protein